MRPLLSGLAAGVLFGLGLTVSGMIDPAKVLGFLDIAGDWDPSLAFVMGGAIPVAALGGVLARRRAAPACAAAFVASSKTRIDTPFASAPSCSASAGASAAMAPGRPWRRCSGVAPRSWCSWRRCSPA